jgi:hypothetical protein
MDFKIIQGLMKWLKNNRYEFFKPYKEVNIYIPELEVIYIGISKTGISSIKSLFLNKLNKEYDANNYNTIHIKGHEVFRYISKKEIITKVCYKFSFVRNPFDRLVSCYKNKIIEENNSLIQTNYGNLFYKDMPFDEFVYNVSNIPDLLSDRHFRSQYSYLYYKGKLLVDFIGKFENINEDYKIIKEKYNLTDLPHINKSNEKKNYRDYYSKELIELVSVRYKNDIEKFNYVDELDELKKYVNNKENLK